MATILYANEFRHESERAVARALDANLPAEACAVANYVLSDDCGGGEIDFVVVLSEGIVCLEVKNWYGRIDRVGAFVEFVDGYRVRAPFDGLKYKHKGLRSFLLNRSLIGEGLAVGSALVTSAQLNWPVQAIIDRHVLSIADLRTTSPLLRALARYDRGLRLDKHQIARVAEELKEAASGLDLWRVGGFVIDEPIGSTDFARTFAARSTEIVQRDALLRCWEIDPLDTEKARSRTLRQIRHEAGALASLERSRCASIPVVYDAFVDPGDFHVFWLAHETLGRTTLAETTHQLWRDSNRPALVVEQLDAALDVMRSAKIVHRNITPDVIYIDDDARILLTGFELSAAEGGTVRKTVSAPRSPEELKGAPQSAKTDLFNAAKIVLDWVAPGVGSVGKKLGTLKAGALRSALSELLQDEPSTRPNHLRDLVVALKSGLPRP